MDAANKIIQEKTNNIVFVCLPEDFSIAPNPPPIRYKGASSKSKYRIK